MAKIKPFEKYVSDYEAWFERHRFVYLSELEAVRHFIPAGKEGIEIGIGTGRFAAPLGIKRGVDPSKTMGKIAARRGLEVIAGTAEALPFQAECFDFALMVTTVCFVDDLLQAFHEAKRVLRPGGVLVLDLVDSASSLGRLYNAFKQKNKFYRVATFYSVGEIIAFLHKSGFIDVQLIQTVFGPLDAIGEVQPFKPGHGEGGFVAVRASKPERRPG